MEALKERGILLRNAPHLVRDQGFVVPNYDWWEAPFYGIGMKVYDLLATRYGFTRSRLLSSQEVKERIPTVAEKGLRGGVLYYDGQFDDARLLINLVQTAARAGGDPPELLLPVSDSSWTTTASWTGPWIQDLESGREHTVRARTVVNATGAFTDQVIQMAEPDAEPMIAASQGVHLVLDRSFLPGETAIMVPRTSDGRVMFAIPWHGHTVVGTTDTPMEEVTLEPRAMEHEEMDFILETAGQYLHRAPRPGDVLSVFAGIRPLVKAGPMQPAPPPFPGIILSTSGLRASSPSSGKVDHLPKHGRGLCGPGRHHGLAWTSAPASRRPSTSTDTTRHRAVRGPGLLRIGCTGGERSHVVGPGVGTPAARRSAHLRGSGDLGRPIGDGSDRG
jgi:glycerol-3-phosphate dehydrogenase